jgi:hypothetical protein
MAIDRVGKGGAPPPAPAASGPSATDRSFVVDVAESTPKTSAAAEVTAAASPLARLRAGEIDLDRYMDLKVDEATRGLHGLSAEELDDVKKVLKDQMATDPGLVDLLRTATGRTPTPPED